MEDKAENQVLGHGHRAVIETLIARDIGMIGEQHGIHHTYNNR